MLSCFYEEELEAMLCGQGEKWSVDLLTVALKFALGGPPPPPPPWPPHSWCHDSGVVKVRKA